MAIPPTPAIAEALPPPAPPGPSRVGPDFLDELDDLSTQVRRLETGVEPDEQEGTARALRQLADVLEVVPGGEELPIDVDAERVRAGQAALVASPAGQTEATRLSLVAATRALEDLARGPYAATPAVAMHANALAREVDALAEPGTLRARRAGAIRALRDAVDALRAIEDAQVLPGADDTSLP